MARLSRWIKNDPSIYSIVVAAAVSEQIYVAFSPKKIKDKQTEKNDNVFDRQKTPTAEEQESMPSVRLWITLWPCLLLLL